MKRLLKLGVGCSRKWVPPADATHWSGILALKCASKIELDDAQCDGRKIIADCMEQGIFVS